MKFEIEKGKAEPSIKEVGEQQHYLKAHENSGLKVGDKVRITRVAKDNEDGWENSWEDEMDDWVGREGTIIEDNDINGFEVKLDHPVDYGNWRFPYFVLEKVNTLTKSEAHRLHKKMWTWLADHPSADKNDIKAVEDWKLEDLKHRCFLCEYYLKVYGDCEFCPLSGGDPKEGACQDRLYGIWQKGLFIENESIKSLSAKLIAEI